MCHGRGEDESVERRSDQTGGINRDDNARGNRQEGGGGDIQTELQVHVSGSDVCYSS